MRARVCLSQLISVLVLVRVVVLVVVVEAVEVFVVTVLDVVVIVIIAWPNSGVAKNADHRFRSLIWSSKIHV